MDFAEIGYVWSIRLARTQDSLQIRSFGRHLLKSRPSCYDAPMKNTSKNNPIKKQGKTFTDKTQLVREATRITLDQYAKTFKDLASYDRTEQQAAR
jgi:hypothetical protein